MEEDRKRERDPDGFDLVECKLDERFVTWISLRSSVVIIVWDELMGVRTSDCKEPFARETSELTDCDEDWSCHSAPVPSEGADWDSWDVGEPERDD